MTSVGVGMLTYNMFATGREADFWQTYTSITAEPWDDFVVLTNGSSDGTEDVVNRLGGIVDNKDSRVWYGNTRLIEELKENDLIILTADDLLYEKGWVKRMVSFMEAAPPEIAIASAYLEPVWQWNEPQYAIEYGGQRAVVRESVCGSSWCFRSADWDWMGPFKEVMPGEDLMVCQKIHRKGFKMAALDLCEHIGVERSAWGNQSHLSAMPFNRERWGLDPAKR